MGTSTANTGLSSCTILWSTQSGRAKACARRACRILKETTSLTVTVGGAFDDYGFAHKLLTPQPHSFPNSHFWLLFVSTTGDGEQCDTIRQTWQALLSKKLSKAHLHSHNFALFALGDRAYGPYFCAGGRKLAARWLQLGATLILPVGYGDDGTPNGGVFADLDHWIQLVLLPEMPTQKDTKATSTINASLSTNLIQVDVDGSGQSINNNSMSTEQQWHQPAYESHYQQFFAQSRPVGAYQYCHQSVATLHPLQGRIVSNLRLTDAEWEQDTRHVTIRVTDATRKNINIVNNTPLPYQAGDVASILPTNSMEEVQRLLKVLPPSIQCIMDHQLDIHAATDCSSSSWPRLCTLRGLLTYCADIQALLEREDLRELSRYCDLNHPMGHDQRDKLLSLSDTSGAALYGDYILREKRSWADVLYDFDSVVLTIEVLLTLLQPMRPRHFSIASAPSLAHHKDRNGFDVELCVAVVEGTTPLGRHYHGLCSTFLSQLDVDASVLFWIRPGSFGKLPLELNEHGRFDTPILCIGAGTGIAPLRSLILEREAVRTAHTGSNENGFADTIGDTSTSDNRLVFGCRKESADFYYHDEWESLVECKHLALWTAFSRDQWHKVYVQQVLRDCEDGTLIAKHLLEQEGAVYVAGGAKMARAVKDELLECLAQHIGETEASLLLKRLNRLGRYNVEAWS